MYLVSNVLPAKIDGDGKIVSSQNTINIGGDSERFNYGYFRNIIATSVGMIDNNGVCIIS
jgi:hypothetical protein